MVRRVFAAILFVDFEYFSVFWASPWSLFLNKPLVVTSSEDRRNGVKLEITKNGIKILNSNGKIQNIENQNVNFRQGLQVCFFICISKAFCPRKLKREISNLCGRAFTKRDLLFLLTAVLLNVRHNNE